MIALMLGLAWAADCPTFRAEVAGHVRGDALAEASGLVASGRDPSRLWSHNDSGDSAALIALGTDGTLHGRYAVAATAIDWEDIARDGTTLFVGDIGDNRAVRPYVSIWVLNEPEGPPGTDPLPAREIRFTYPGGPRDAEVLLAEPGSGKLFVVSKGREQEHVIYEVPLDGGEAQRRGTLPWVAATPYRTAGDVAPEGRAVILRGYTFGWWYVVPPGGGVLEALATTPCPFPTVPEAQGEAVAFGAGGVVYTVSEHGDQPLWRYRPSL